MTGGWELDDLKELAAAILQMAVNDYHHRHPGTCDHRSAQLFIYSNAPKWREVRRLWVTVAFLEKGGI